MAKSNDSTHSVYRIVCFVNGKCYVGQTNDVAKRKKTHFTALAKQEHHSPYLQHSYIKYGRKSFFFEVLEDGIAQEEINAREIHWIQHFDSYQDGFNMTMGGHDRTNLGKGCVWEGIAYPSVPAAARAIGINTPAMWRRIKDGYTCEADRKNTRAPKSVTWNGVTYSTAAEAARSLGISHSAIVNRIERGFTCDADVGVEIQTIWNGTTYPSIKIAAESNGYRPNNFLHWLRKGCRCDDDVRAIRKPKIVWNGVEYETIDDAAKAINIPYGTMEKRLRTGWKSDADVINKSTRQWSPKRSKHKVE